MINIIVYFDMLIIEEQQIRKIIKGHYTNLSSPQKVTSQVNLKQMDINRDFICNNVI